MEYQKGILNVCRACRGQFAGDGVRGLCPSCQKRETEIAAELAWVLDMLESGIDTATPRAVKVAFRILATGVIINDPRFTSGFPLPALKELLTDTVSGTLERLEDAVQAVCAERKGMVN